MAKGLSDTLDDLEELRARAEATDELLVGPLEVAALRNTGKQFLANLREPIVVQNVAKHLTARGKHATVLDFVKSLERGEPS